MSKAFESKSKFLSLILRHKPEAIGLILDPEGWADLDELIRLANARGTALTRELVREIVASNDKQRFALSPDGLRIRANQGHSVHVDLKLEPQQPPAILFHGTATRFVASILEAGLRPGSRQHVHLSAGEDTAISVGGRHGKPVVLTVRAAEMVRDGHRFYRSANGVWLTDLVPPGYLDYPGDA